MAYIYLKKPPREKARGKNFLVSSLFLTAGLFLFGLVVWPIASFELLVSPKLSGVVSPIPQEPVVLGSQATQDFTLASNWFPTAPKGEASPNVGSYSLSIPRLGIDKATTIVGAEDLSRSLIQWGGTALPGEFGNTVIFGHSVLPVFFNPQNYTTIFSTLPTLKEGDEIFVYFDGITYRYQVFEMRVVAPEDISVLEQKYDDSYISLITCVPPGTYWKRLVVKARLTKI